MKTVSLFLAFLILPWGIVLSQTKGKSKETFAFSVNSKEYTAKFDVLANKEHFVPDHEVTYYWYSTNKVLETRGGYDGKLLHGNYAAFYLNNNLKEKGTFKKGVKTGEWITWYDNGIICEITHWKGGLKSGNYESYDPLGRPVLKAEFKKGMLNGTMKSYNDGKISNTSRYKMDKELVNKSKGPGRKVKEGLDTKIPSDSGKNKHTSFFKKLISKKKTNKNSPEKNKQHFMKKKKDLQPAILEPPTVRSGESK